MKPVRLLLLGAAACALLVIAAVVVAFNSSFQTWAARRVLAKQPGLQATLGSVSAGLGRVELRNFRAEVNGAILTLPALDADLPLVSAGLKDKVLVTRLVAKGWTLDLSKMAKLTKLALPSTQGVVRAEREFSLFPSALAADTAAAASQVFQGVFSQLHLPVDFALDGVSLEGEVILPAARGHARVTLTGGGLGAGQDGKFDLTAGAALTSPAVSTLEARATLTATMDTQRSFSRLGVK